MLFKQKSVKTITSSLRQNNRMGEERSLKSNIANGFEDKFEYLDLLYKELKLFNLNQSPTGHPNQIAQATESHALPVVSQCLQIIHKFYRNLSCSRH